MSIITILKLISHSLTAHKGRTFLTLLGVIVSVMAIMIVVTLGESVEKYVLSEIESFGTQTVQVEVKVPSTEHLSTDNAAGIAQGITITTLTLDDAKAIAKLPHVADYSAGLIGQKKTRRGSISTQALLLGASSATPFVDPNVDIKTGMFFDHQHEKSLAQVAVLGSAIKEELFGKNINAIGERIKIGTQSYRVVGTLEERGATFGFSFDDIIYLPVTTMQKKIMGIDYLQYITVRAVDGVDAAIVAQDVRAVLQLRHGTDGNSDDFGVTTIQEAQDMLEGILGGITLLIVLLAGISLLVGGVGIMNVMLVAVEERMQEIGLRRSLGARRSDIRTQFLTEAVVIALIGSVAGIVLGAFLIIMAAALSVQFGFDIPISVSITGPLIGITFALVAGTLFGYYPARRAAAISPIEALRR